MDCREVRENLHAWIDGEVAEERSPAIRAHLADCEECAHQVESGRRLKHLIRVKAQRALAPAGLKDRVRELIAREPTPGSRRKSTRWISVAAAVTIALGLGAFFLATMPQRLVHADVVRQALHNHVSFQNPEGMAELEKAASICQRILGVEASLPVFDREQVVLRSICTETFGDYEAAHLLYECGPRKFSVFAIHDPSIEMAETETPRMIDGVICCCLHGEEYSVLCRRLNDTYLCIVVNDDAERFYQEVLKEAMR